MQSERLFSAIKAQGGGTVRFVPLGLDSRGNTASESVLHWFWEMNK
jgi:hypothetical protein